MYCTVAMPSGWYMPSTGRGSIALAWLSRSLESSPAPATLWFLKPSPTSFVTRFSFRSMMPSALFSWSVTQAVFESCDTAMYSGSRSCATVAPGP